MAEGARLESVYTGNRIVGSNPTPSARLPSANVRDVTVHAPIVVPWLSLGVHRFSRWSLANARATKSKPLIVAGICSRRSAGS